MSMSNQRIPHSAQVSMMLHVAGLALPVSQMGPEFIILRTALEQELLPTSGIIALTVDGKIEHIPVDFPQGIPSGQRRVALAEPEEALVEA